MTQMQLIEVDSPADGGIAGTVPSLGSEAVRLRAAQLREAQPAWEALGAEGRGRVIAAYRDWLLDHAGPLTDLLQRETGKVRHEAALEVDLAGDLLNYFARIAGGALATEQRKPHSVMSATKRLSVSYRPHQLVGIITPWNFPIAGPFMDIAPALAAGAAVLVKPSEVTPLALDEALKGWREVGAPDVFAAVTGAGETGAALIDEVDMIQFTGSTGTGRRIAVRAAERLIPCSLELGGKDPMIVLADADLDRAVNAAAWGALFNAGQVCVSVERVYVESPVYAEFVTRLAEKVAGLSTSRDVGALATPAQVDIVERHVTEALAGGARALTGGRRGTVGTRYEPTVLVDVDHSMSCMREETFGPTIPVMRVADVDEAVRLANDSPYGLSASVWTSDVEAGMAVAERLDAGAVNVNDVLANLFSFTLPHGGWKDSGIGSRFGAEAAIRKYCRAKAITTPAVAPKNELMWFPYTPARSKVVHRALRALTGRGKRRFGKVG
jgi:acyl-CoA reductase-like NAD-dependent aldehyde dehydrogenase